MVKSHPPFTYLRPHPTPLHRTMGSIQSFFSATAPSVEVPVEQVEPEVEEAPITERYTIAQMMMSNVTVQFHKDTPTLVINVYYDRVWSVHPDDMELPFDVIDAPFGKVVTFPGSTVYKSVYIENTLIKNMFYPRINHMLPLESPERTLTSYLRWGEPNHKVPVLPSKEVLAWGVMPADMVVAEMHRIEEPDADLEALAELVVSWR
jgi:hypothetical protein